MYLLTLYDKIASALTPEDIGNRILPGLIPMLISASLSKPQFAKLIGTIWNLLTQIENHWGKDLQEFDNLREIEDRKDESPDDIFA